MVATEDRPFSKTLLPIRIEPSIFAGRPAYVFAYESTAPRPTGPVKIPMRHVAQSVLDLLMVDCLKAYYELENKVDGMSKDKDEALEAANKAKHDLKMANDKIAELERRCKRAEDRAKKAEDKLMEQ